MEVEKANEVSIIHFYTCDIKTDFCLFEQLRELLEREANRDNDSDARDDEE